MSANRQILARPDGPSRSIQVNRKTRQCRAMSAFASNSRRWMRRTWFCMGSSLRPSRTTALKANKQRCSTVLLRSSQLSTINHTFC